MADLTAEVKDVLQVLVHHAFFTQMLMTDDARVYNNPMLFAAGLKRSKL